jgi:hypothetical protein
MTKQCVLTKAAPDLNHRASSENATCQTTALEISIHSLLELGEPLAAVPRPTCQHYTLQGRTANQRRAQFKNTKFWCGIFEECLRRYFVIIKKRGKVHLHHTKGAEKQATKGKQTKHKSQSEILKSNLF